ncbi:3'-5' exonuclease [Virgibacillus sp. NKC19-3]|uniref:3'-5' exonuclease n=1 Tax=Virgibacillus saliphilus TaxID=2831674 RepID=UPI001C9B9C92|nr:3'-5' exonuclease [Virgibacillus sp. NKC19-3]MBY7142950.1 3'-5' exonuclease [Virgibacillus sp. NKC19-3]
MHFVSIDFETANEKRFSPCAIGVVVANEHEILDEFYSLINPLMGFSSFHTDIHGITKSDVVHAPTFPQVWPTLHEYLSQKVVIAHNASFDMSVLRQTLDYFNLSYPDMDYLCTANISKRVWPGLTNHKLNTLAMHHGIAFEHHHALEDARVAAEILRKALSAYQAESLDPFLEKCKMTKGRIYEHGYVPPRAKKPTKRKRKLYF